MGKSYLAKVKRLINSLEFDDTSTKIQPWFDLWDVDQLFLRKHKSVVFLCKKSGVLKIDSYYGPIALSLYYYGDISKVAMVSALLKYGKIEIERH